MKVFIDTELTAMPLFGLPPSDPGQPRVVEIGIVVEDGPGWKTTDTYAGLCSLIALHDAGAQLFAFYADLDELALRIVAARSGISMPYTFEVACVMQDVIRHFHLSEGSIKLARAFALLGMGDPVAVHDSLHDARSAMAVHHALRRSVLGTIADAA